MKRYKRPDIVKFLRAVDGLLKKEIRLVVIGGSAAVLQYESDAPTSDIDTIGVPPDELQARFARMRKKTGLEIAVVATGVYEAPYHYQDRLEPLKVRLKNLKIFVPEVHDLLLMKAARGEHHDVQAFVGIHKKAPLDLDVLIHRYDSEMDHVLTVPPTEFRRRLRVFIQELFGDEGVKKFEAVRPPVEKNLRV